MWQKLSMLGIKDTDTSLEILSKKLCNQINISIAVLMLMLFLALRVIGYLQNEFFIGFSSYRILLTMLLAIVNIFLAYCNKNDVSKIILIFFIPFTFLIFPTVFGFVEAESFTYYPFIVIASSIIPQLILKPEREKFLYWTALLYYFSLLLGINYLLLLFVPQHFEIIDVINTFQVYFILAQIAIFLFINGSVFYLRRLNQNFEEELISVNECLDEKTRDLQKKNEQLEQYRQELSKQNIELQKALEVIRTTQQKLIQSEKMAALGILIAGVAHEINNPMNYVAGGASLLESDLEDFISSLSVNDRPHNLNEIKESIDRSMLMIQTGVRKSAAIISSLRSYSSDTSIHGEYLDIHRVIDSALEFLESKIGQDITIEKNFNLNDKVFVFKDKIHQAFLNIIDNAVYALKSTSGNRKTLFISTFQDQNVAVISFINNGPCIPEGIVNRIYDPFFTTKGPSDGTGLGMAITYNVIKEHNGSIDLINNLEEVGFVIRLRLKDKKSIKDFVLYDL